MNDNQLPITTLISDNWKHQLKRTSDLFNLLTDKQRMQEIASGRNRSIYSLVHLTAVHDRKLSLLSLAEQLYPKLDEPFLTQPDKSAATLPTRKELGFSVKWLIPHWIYISNQ